MSEQTATAPAKTPFAYGNQVTNAIETPTTTTSKP